MLARDLLMPSIPTKLFVHQDFLQRVLATTTLIVEVSKMKRWPSLHRCKIVLPLHGKIRLSNPAQIITCLSSFRKLAPTSVCPCIIILWATIRTSLDEGAACYPVRPPLGWDLSCSAVYIHLGAYSIPRLWKAKTFSSLDCLALENRGLWASVSPMASNLTVDAPADLEHLG